MCSNYYEGFVPMKPEMEKREFFSGDDDFSYQIPEVYFECTGEADHSHKAFEWSDDSVIVIKDNRVVKYTDDTSYDLLMTDENGQKEWVEGRLAELMGWDVKDVNEIRRVKTYWIEEYDLNKSEKRKYRVVLEKTTKMDDFDDFFLKNVINKGTSSDSTEFTMTET